MTIECINKNGFTNIINRTEEYLIDLAPVVLFCYKRISMTKKVIDCLRKNQYAEYTDLYIYSDGWKNEFDKDLVLELRKYINSIKTGFKSINIFYRKMNYGLANNIIEGVTEVINKHGKIIVLEDDILTSRYFLKYMNDALFLYESNRQVMEITSCSSFGEKIGMTDACFLGEENCWGWATWEDRWHFFDRNPRLLINEFTNDDIRRFTLNGTNDFWHQVEANFSGISYTWAVFWAATIYRMNGLVLYPPVNMTSNIGYDGMGDNAVQDCKKNIINVSSMNIYNQIDRFPLLIEENSIIKKEVISLRIQTNKWSKIEHNLYTTSPNDYVNRNFVIYGCSDIGIMVYRWILKCGGNVLFFIDRNAYNLRMSNLPYDVYPLEEVKILQNVTYILATTRYADDMKKQLCKKAASKKIMIICLE